MEEEPGSSMEGNFSKTKGIDLQHEWTLWIDVSPPEIFAEERISNYLIKLGSFSTIKKFWMFWNNMDFIFSKIPSTANLRLFRSDKTPYKTNNSSDSKGYWRISLRVDQIRQFWLNMAIAAIGENLEPIDSLNGIVLCIRDKNPELSVWTSLSHNDQNIEFQLKTIFRITNDAALPFQPLNMDRIMEGIPRQINNKVSQDSEGDDFDKKRKLFTDTAGSKIFLKYDPLFLTRFSFSNSCRKLPKELESIQWEEIARESELFSKSNQRLYNRRSSWTEPINFNNSVTNQTDFSLDALKTSSKSYESQNFKTEHFKHPYTVSGPFNSPLGDRYSGRRQSLPILSTNFSLASTNSEEFITQGFVNSALKIYLDEFYFSVVEELTPELLKIFLEEHCPFCLSDQNPLFHRYVVIQCRLLKCKHVAHGSCVLEFLKENREIRDLKLMQKHTTNYFHIAPMPLEDLIFLSRDPPGTKRFGSLSLNISHFLNRNTIMRIEWPHFVSTLIDRRNEKEYLLLALGQREDAKFRISRGKITFQCVDLNTNEIWEYGANFDLSRVNTQFAKLIFVDEKTEHSLSINVRRYSDGSEPQFSFCSVEYKFHNSIGDSISRASPSQSRFTVNAPEFTPLKDSSAVLESRMSYPNSSGVFTGNTKRIHSKSEISNSKVFNTLNTANIWTNEEISNQKNNQTWNLSVSEKMDKANVIENRSGSSPDYLLQAISPENSVSADFKEEGHSQLNWENLVGKLSKVITTQVGSRFIQEKLSEGNELIVDQIFSEICSCFCETMMDNFGHYAAQKIFEVCRKEQKQKIILGLHGHIDKIACHKQGSFSLQGLMDHINDDSILDCLIQVLEPNLTKIIMNSSGHYVILKFLQKYYFPKTRFIHSNIEKHILSLSCDHYGLRVIKATIEAGPTSELGGIFKIVAKFTMKIVENQYGNYIIQQVLEVAQPSICNSIKMKMEGKYVRLAKQKFSSNVVETCLKRSNSGWRDVIIKELCASSGKLIKDRYGNYVLQTALAHADSNQVKQLTRALNPFLGSLRENVKTKWKNILAKAASGEEIGESILFRDEDYS